MDFKFFKINGADFVCVPCRFETNKLRYKLCWVKKIYIHAHTLTIDYDFICAVASLKEAKNSAKLFLEYYFMD